MSLLVTYSLSFSVLLSKIISELASVCAIIPDVCFKESVRLMSAVVHIVVGTGNKL